MELRELRYEDHGSQGLTYFWEYGNMAFMKTTLEIDEDLYRQAKSAAALSGRRMKDLVAEGLRLVLSQAVRKEPSLNVLGCLSQELKGRSISDVMNELRGPAEKASKSK